MLLMDFEFIFVLIFSVCSTLPSILIKLSKISATVPMSIPMLEFLSSMSVLYNFLYLVLLLLFCGFL